MAENNINNVDGFEELPDQNRSNLNPNGSAQTPTEKQQPDVKNSGGATSGSVSAEHKDTNQKHKTKKSTNPGAAVIDYSKIEGYIKQLEGKITPVDLSAVESELKSIKNQLDNKYQSIAIDYQKIEGYTKQLADKIPSVNLSNIEADLFAIKSKLEKIEAMPQPEEINYTKIQDGLRQINTPNLEQIKKSLNEIENQMRVIAGRCDTTQNRISALEVSDKSGTEKLFEQIIAVNSNIVGVSRDIKNLASDSSLCEIWKNPSGLNDISAKLDSIKTSYLTLSRDIGLLKTDFKGVYNDNLSGRIDNLKSELKSEVYMIGNKVSEIESNVSATLLKYAAGGGNLSTGNYILDTLKDLTTSVGELKSQFSVIDNSLHAFSQKKISSEKKLSFVCTAIFTILLVFGAIFVTRGFLTVFTNEDLLIAALVLFCISVMAICAFNLYFALANESWPSNKVLRYIYCISCGILSLATFTLGMAILLI